MSGCVAPYPVLQESLSLSPRCRPKIDLLLMPFPAVPNSDTQTSKSGSGNPHILFSKLHPYKSCPDITCLLISLMIEAGVLHKLTCGTALTLPSTSAFSLPGPSPLSPEKEAQLTSFLPQIPQRSLSYF